MCILFCYIPKYTALRTCHGSLGNGEGLPRGKGVPLSLQQEANQSTPVPVPLQASRISVQ